MQQSKPNRGSIHVGCSEKARNPNKALNPESVKNDRAYTGGGAEITFIALFAVGVTYVNEAANNGITTRDDKGSDGVSTFSS